MSIKSTFKKVMDGDHSSEYGVFVVSVISVTLALTMFLVASTVNEVREYWFIGKSPEYINVLPVTGKGEVVAATNIATFSFSIVEKGKTIAEAQNTANSRNNEIIAYLKSNGVDEKDIKTTGYNAYPDYTYNPTTGKQTLNGFEVSINVTVKARNADAGNLLSAVGDMGVSNISGLTFTVDDKDSLKREARSLAIADARAQAEKLANELGLKLGKVTGYYEMEDYGPYPMYEGMGGDMMKSASVAPNIESGENTIVSRVSVTFEIID